MCLFCLEGWVSFCCRCYFLLEEGEWVNNVQRLPEESDASGCWPTSAGMGSVAVRRSHPEARRRRIDQRTLAAMGVRPCRSMADAAHLFPSTDVIRGRHWWAPLKKMNHYIITEDLILQVLRPLPSLSRNHHRIESERRKANYLS